MMKYFVGIFLLGILSLTSCRPKSFEIDYSIILESHEMTIYEPSGLSFSSDKKYLYTVSDRGSAYKISLTGKTIEELSFTGDDFEGITIYPITSDIYICQEGKGNLVKLNSAGILQNTYDIIDSPGNNGLEGLCYNADLNEFYLLKEMSDGLLIKYSVENNTKTQIILNFAYDYSGIYYNNISKKLWIVSDESKTLTQCDLNGNKIKDYKLPISGVEGIVVNDEETIAYVVSDPNNKLYKIDLTLE